MFTVLKDDMNVMTPFRLDCSCSTCVCRLLQVALNLSTATVFSTLTTSEYDFSSETWSFFFIPSDFCSRCSRMGSGFEATVASRVSISFAMECSLLLNINKYLNMSYNTTTAECRGTCGPVVKNPTHCQQHKICFLNEVNHEPPLKLSQMFGQN